MVTDVREFGTVTNSGLWVVSSELFTVPLKNQDILWTPARTAPANHQISMLKAS